MLTNTIIFALVSVEVVLLMCLFLPKGGTPVQKSKRIVSCIDHFSEFY